MSWEKLNVDFQFITTEQGGGRWVKPRPLAAFSELENRDERIFPRSAGVAPIKQTNQHRENDFLFSRYHFLVHVNDGRSHLTMWGGRELEYCCDRRSSKQKGSVGSKLHDEGQQIEKIEAVAAPYDESEVYLVTVRKPPTDN